MKSRIKRIISFALVLAMLLSLASCGEYNAAVKKDKDKKPTAEVKPGDNSEGSFTVQLRANEKPYYPTTAIDIYWNDGYNVHVASVDEYGFASISGLDGDYSVTLSSVPSGYAYDSNAYIATNDNRNIIIDMYDLNILRGEGKGLYECYNISEPGVYTVTVNSESDYSYVQFAPQLSGTYTVESWVSAVEDEVSPICMAYLGSSQYKYGEYKVTDVGICGSYTRNFIHTVEIASQNISSGGSQTFTFAVSAETKSGVYPVNLTFAVKRNGEFDLELREKSIIIPKQNWDSFDFDAFNSLAGGNLVGAEMLYSEGLGTYIFDQDYYKVWEVSEGGDGVYHLYDPEKYPETNGYGPILVAYITEACRFIDKSFTTIEDAGNNSLIVNGTENYRLFIKGFEGMAASGYFCLSDCPCHVDGTTLACLEGCPDCKSDCTNATAEQMAVKGYADYVNADGVAPVTPELKQFLQSFAITRGYFADGEGWVESNPTLEVDAYEDSQWLFACGYYK